MNSTRLIPPARGRGGRFRLADRPEGNHTRFCHRALGAEAGDELRQYLSDQPRLVLIDFGRSGFAAPFLFVPFFHDAASNKGGQHDHV